MKAVHLKEVATWDRDWLGDFFLKQNLTAALWKHVYHWSMVLVWIQIRTNGKENVLVLLQYTPNILYETTMHASDSL